MNIQTISIVVPAKGCVNSCKFCISNQHNQDYKFAFDYRAIKKRLKYAVANQVTTCVITGTGEVLQNIRFLNELLEIFEELDHPFPNIAVQTTGVMLTAFNIDLFKKLGVNTISLSVSDIFSDANNWDINGTPKNLQVPLETLTKTIIDAGMTLRLSLNLTKAYENITPMTIVARCKELGAEQITFRELYAETHSVSREAEWVNYNGLVALRSANGIHYGRMAIKDHVQREGQKLYQLPFGPYVYSLNGMSTVVDDDCMASEHEADQSLKYVILRENGK